MVIAANKALKQVTNLIQLPKHRITWTNLPLLFYNPNKTYRASLDGFVQNGIDAVIEMPNKI